MVVKKLRFNLVHPTLDVLKRDREIVIVLTIHANVDDLSLEGVPKVVVAMSMAHY